MSDDDPSRPLATELYEVAHRMFPVISRYTACLLAPNPKGPEGSAQLAGTGVFLQIADKHFLVTAAHVADIAFKDGLPFLVPRKAGQASHPLQLNFVDGHYVTEYDISVLELDQPTAAELKGFHDFLVINDLDPQPLHPDAGLVVQGFPAQFFRIDEQRLMHVESLGWITTQVRGPYKEEWKHKDLVLRYDPVAHNLEHQTGTTPRPFGLSGCGIWRIANSAYRPRDTLHPYPRLVGIEHSTFRKDHVLAGTSISRVLDMIANAYPELRNSISIFRIP